MGLLDDAIREHLDLKRRRGADPSEIERAEREALGPVRRGPEPEAATDEPVGYDLGPDPEWDEEPVENGQASERAGGAYPEPAGPPEPLEPSEGPPPPTFSRPHERSRADDPFVDDPLADDPFSAGDDPAVPPPHPAAGSGAEAGPEAEAPGGETVEYHVEEAFKSPAEEEHAPEREPAAEGEDPLEETPEFLQDTPDHDRLWFEQKPPRDFDFEG